ncbi:MAG: alpha-2-macroglobulin [Flavobacteriaceae bacterium]|nr:alpha-2-macroglobulin [Flavobacteriaceae bacterium]
MRSILTLSLLLLISQMTQSQNAPYENLWNEVEQLELEGRPKSALSVLDKIYKRAKKDNNSPQLIKIQIFKSKFALILEEDAQLKIIDSFKHEIEISKPPVKQVLHSIIADLYWDFFEQHRWKFYNRTQTKAKVEESDFRTWDLQTLFAEVQFHFDQSLQNAPLLQELKIETFKDLLIKSNRSDEYYPTVYDFLAHRALDFYETDERTIIKPSYKFELDDIKLADDPQTFFQLDLIARDSTSQHFKALKLYQELLRFHFDKSPSQAFVHLDIKRLNFVRSYARFPFTNETYLATLKRQAQAFQDHSASGLYSFEIANFLYEEGLKYIPGEIDSPRWKLSESFDLCKQIIDKFPDSEAATNSKILQQRINAKHLTIQSESFIPTGKKSRILIHYSNYDYLSLKVFPITRPQVRKLQSIYRKDEQYEFIKTLKASHNWKSSLRDEGDYQKHRTELILPDVSNGYHLIYASDDDNKGDMFAYSILQATQLAILNKPETERQIFQLIDRENGRPIRNASLRFSYRTNRNNERTEFKKTDERGEVSFKKNGDNYWGLDIRAAYKNEIAYFDGYYISSYNRRNRQAGVRQKAFIFTDRSIYRPGQTVFFKAINLTSNGQRSEVIPDELFKVAVFDVNNNEVSKLELTSNAFGSISGSFIIPDSGLNGLYSIKVYSDSKKIDVDDRYSFSVEEYKRPKFEVSFKPISEAFRLNDSVQVSGEALAYSGPAISNAKVVYRVHRQVIYPRWYYWYRPFISSEPQEITFGETTTDEKGNFDIEFKAIPDQSANKDDQPIFHYEVNADITDINGETRGKSMIVKVGYHSLIAEIKMPEWINKNSKEHLLELNTTNLNGEFEPSKGTIKIYKLQNPGRVLRPRPWNAPDYQEIDEETFKNEFPHDAYKNEHDKRIWAKGKLVYQSNFDSEISKEIRLKDLKKWLSGTYSVVLETKDRFGQNVKDEIQTVLYSQNDKTPSDLELFTVNFDKPEYKPGDKVRLKLSSSAHIFLTLEVEKDHTVISTEVLELNRNSQTLEIDVNSNDLGGFAINYSYAAFNSFASESKTINVPYPSKKLNIETLTFRDRLTPGADETWSFKIKGPEGNKVAAELLASMYDASLDQFKAHDWRFDPFPKSTYYSYGYRQGRQSFGITNFRIYQRPASRRSFLKPDYNKFNWFGFSFNNPWHYEQYLSNLKFKKSIIKSGNISGMVSDQTGPLPGVNIIVKGTSLGTQTDFDGNYWIDAKADDVLVFSYVGYETTERMVGKDKTINIVLQEDTAALEEVVVTAQGVKRSRGAKGYALADSEAEAVDFSMNGAPQPEDPDSPSELTADSFEGIQIRKNFQETAFFFPELQTDENGQVSFSFKTPEALTKWKLQLLAHTADTKHTTMTLEARTQKDLMVIPNPPRFLREGDSIVFSSKISNMTENPLKGTAVLQLFDALTGSVVDSELRNVNSIRSFELKAAGNTEVSWTLVIPEQVQALQYKVLARTNDFSDGEQNVLPVLNNRKLVTETLPMWISSNETKTFLLEKLIQSDSKTLKHQNLSLEMTSNPAWYAVQALPYLMEFPHECNEQLFSRFYANALATHIANSNPRIKEVFEQWKNSEALLSNLEKNPELKSILINETPWLRDAQSEAEQKKRIGLLFDLNHMSSELKAAYLKLKRNQLPVGAWPWFRGGRESRFITQHIVAGFGHLNQLKVEHPNQEKMIAQAIQYLDAEFIKSYHDIRKYDKDIDMSQDHLSHIQLHYLYMRSFFMDIKTSSEQQKIIDFYLDQIDSYWLNKSLYSKGLMTLISNRFSRTQTANAILRSLKETSITSEELGMYWKENSSSWYWYQSAVETQALMVETFAELAADNADIDQLKVWLLKNKQTNRWSTTKATTEAVYALLLQGNDWLSNTKLVEIELGNERVDPYSIEDTKIEAGTGYFKTSWTGPEIKPEMGKVVLKKEDDGIAWGGLYWQYFEDLDKIDSAETPLKLDKKLFIKTNSDFGEQLTAINDSTQVRVGDLIRVRIVLRADRPMEFLHMNDMRASGLEPVNVISQYKWQDGLGYYESTKDASTNFFIDWLPKGLYVFEYDLRANNSGNFSNGITTIQSMYAPEFSSHSEGVRIRVER